MTWDPTPWSIGGGAEHGPELLRLVAYATTGGVEGVVNALDAKVVALTVPAGQVNIYPGSVIMRNRYDNSQQSYIGRASSFDTVSIAPTGGASRSDLVIARVLDPQYEGQPPADPNNFQAMRTQIITGVPAGTTSFGQLGMSFPGFALARIDIPPSTGAITDGMIKDLRAIALPRSQRRRISAFPSVIEEVNPVSTSSAPDTFPNQGIVLVAVPEWATQALMRVDVAGVYVVGAAVSGGFGCSVGSQSVQNSRFTSKAVGERLNLLAGGEVLIPGSMRGTNQNFKATAYRDSGGVSSLRADAGTAILMEIEFTETVI